MACNSDYLEPTSREKELQRAAKLLVFLRKKLGMGTERWMRSAAGNKYAEDSRAIPELCALLKAMSQENLEAIVYNAHDSQSRDLANWWEEHQAADAKREAQEAEEAKVASIRAAALAKLTDEERAALGLDS